MQKDPGLSGGVISMTDHLTSMNEVLGSKEKQTTPLSQNILASKTNRWKMNIWVKSFLMAGLLFVT